MILHTETIYQLADIETATLEESGTGEGVMNLEFAGFGPDWLTYLEPVTVYHKGRLLFHGKITQVLRSNGGAPTSSATINNFMWLLTRQTLGQQIAEIEAAAQESNSGNGGSSGTSSGRLTARMLNFTAGQIGKSTAGKTGGVTWGSVTASMSVQSAGWKASTTQGGAGIVPAAVDDDAGGWMPDVLTVKASPSVAGRTVWAVTDKLITTASALVKMREKAADIQFIIDYAAGTCTAMAIGDMPALTWDTSARDSILDMNGITPQYEACVTGVAVAWTSDTGSVSVHCFPQDLSMSQDGVKVFSLSGSYYVESWDKVAREYYEAANVLQWGGSVTVLQSYVDGSPLGGKINLIGPGTHESWQTMEAVVSSCSWDFLDHTLTVNLGREFADPEFDDAQPTEDGGEGEDGNEGGGDDPGDDPEDGTAEDSLDDDFPIDSGVDPGGSWDDSAASDGPEESEEEPGSGSSPGGSGTASGSGSIPGGSGTASGSGGSQGGSGTGSGSGSSTGGSGTASGGGSGQGGGGTGSSGGSGQGGGGTGSGGGSSPGGSGTPCDCAEKWAALEEWKRGIEERITALEARGYNFNPDWFEVSGNNVNLRAGKMDELVQDAVDELTVELDVSGIVTETEYGALRATTTASGSLQNLSVNSHIGY